MLQRSEEIIIELKYCERCGGLWFREAGSNANLCGPCTNEEPVLAKRYAERAQQATVDRAWAGVTSMIVERLEGVSTEMGRQV
jgi:Zn-finger nucleic acid-binding protein